MNPERPEPFYICGPTASGKSALALEMAEKLDGEIVNADAFQLYRGLELISAAPSEDEMAKGMAQLRDLDAGTQEMVALGEVPARLAPMARG